MLCLLLALLSGCYWIFALPLLPLLIMAAVMDYRPFFWFLLVMIPLGTELVLPGGMSTDFPTEPIAVGLTALLCLHAAVHWPEYDHRLFLHPIALALYLHLSWIVLSSAFGEVKLVSIKFSLAKLWYVGAFFLVPLLLLTTPRRVTLFVHCVFWPLLFVAVQSLLRHAVYGFSFADQFRTLHPFMRNHVSYAGCLATFTPWLGYLIWWRWRRGLSHRWLAYGLGLVWLAAIYFAYTRAAYVALLVAGVAYFVIRLRLMLLAVPLALAVGLGAAYYLTHENKYLDLAPNYDTTVAHQDFNDLISATYKLEDISTMERFYRWVAGGNMVAYRPVVGHGPGSFVGLYEGYTNNNFRTYVSDNPERSGIHNYYLMTLVEQGYVGLVVLLLFLFSILIYGERLYHGQGDPEARAAVMAGLLSVVVVDAFCVINDVLETDKIGSLFFIGTAVVIALGNYRSPGQISVEKKNDP